MNDEEMNDDEKYINDMLKFAVKNDNVDLFNELLENDINFSNIYIYVMDRKYIKYFNILLNKVDPSINNNAVINYALWSGFFDIVEILLMDERVNPDEYMNTFCEECLTNPGSWFNIRYLKNLLKLSSKSKEKLLKTEFLDEFYEKIKNIDDDDGLESLIKDEIRRRMNSTKSARRFSRRFRRFRRSFSR